MYQLYNNGKYIPLCSDFSDLVPNLKYILNAAAQSMDHNNSTSDPIRFKCNSTVIENASEADILSHIKTVETHKSFRIEYYDTSKSVPVHGYSIDIFNSDFCKHKSREEATLMHMADKQSSTAMEFLVSLFPDMPQQINSLEDIRNYCPELTL